MITTKSLKVKSWFLDRDAVSSQGPLHLWLQKKSSISFVLRVVHLPDVFSFVHRFMYSITLEVAWSLTSHLHTKIVLSEVFSFNRSKSPIFFLLPGTQCFMYRHCSWQVYPFKCALRGGQFSFVTLP